MPSNKEYHKEYKKEYRKRNKYVNISMPLDIYACLEKLAKIDETNVIALMRKITIEHVTHQPTIPKIVVDDLREVKFLIMNVANNINQIAHHSNTIKGLVDDNALLEHIRKLDEAVKKYTKGEILK